MFPKRQQTPRVKKCFDELSVNESKPYALNFPWNTLELTIKDKCFGTVWAEVGGGGMGEGGEQRAAWNSLCVPWQQAFLFHSVHAPKVPDALTNTQFLNG